MDNILKYGFVKPVSLFCGLTSGAFRILIIHMDKVYFRSDAKKNSPKPSVLNVTVAATLGENL